MNPDASMLDAQGKPLPPSACPKCGYEFDAATVCDEKDPEQKARPKPGDLSICLKCGTALQFTETMMLEAVNVDELDADDDTKFQLRRIQQHIRMKRPIP